MERLFLGLCLVFGLFFAGAYLVYVERKIIARIQRRIGPNVVGPFGLLQPIADAIKLLNKSYSRPVFSQGIIFYLFPIVAFSLHVTCWVFIPFGFNQVLSNGSIGILYIMMVTNFNTYMMAISGWASNSKYALLGALRLIAKMLSYEVSIGFVFLSLFQATGSFSLQDIVLYQQHYWNVINFFPLAIIFFIAGLAEINRIPFDFLESESELMGGILVEYSAMIFGFLFLLEYASLFLFCAIFSLLFLGGWTMPWTLIDDGYGWIWMMGKIIICLFLCIWIRATFPRVRYDQLVRFGWCFLMPISFAWFFIQSCIVFIQHYQH